MGKLLVLAGLFCVAGLGSYVALTAPFTWELLHQTRDVPNTASPDIANGKSLFYAGSCGTCHATPNQSDETLLGGGQELTSGFGNFYMPNISPDPHAGIGSWTTAQFVRAVREGVSNTGANLYPALPYTSYQRMNANDLRDLFFYIKTLTPASARARGNDLKFPFTMRSGVGLWKLLYLDGQPLDAPKDKAASWQRGQYLVEGPGHCAECHSPRNALGAIADDKRFSGGPDPAGAGYVPNITPDNTGIGYWSQNEIAIYLATGTTPIGTQAGGSMVPIIANMARLTVSDRQDMAEYIKTLPPVDSPDAGAPEPNLTSTVQILPPTATATRSPANVLSVQESALGSANVLYAVAVKPIFLDRIGALTKSDGDGNLLPAAKITVISRDGDWLKVKIDGWQQDGSPAAFYALEGKRIVIAALSPAAIAKVVRMNTTIDPETKQTWFSGSLTIWITTADLNPDITKLWSYSASLYTGACSVCHAEHPANEFLANQWIGNLGAMKRFAALDDDQYRMLQAYLQFHAKDVDVQTESGAP